MNLVIASISLSPLEILESHEGGFGKVLIVRDGKNTKYALKFIKSGQSEEAIEEGLKLINLPAHPNLIEIIGIENVENEKVIVLEYCQKSLSDVIENSLTDEEIDKILFDVASGICVLHEKCSMLHLDLKPQNILFSKNKNWVISDFGLSKIITQKKPTDSETIKSFSGTISHMAPEQIVYGLASKKSDVFAFGVILFKILTGRHPFIDSPITSVEDAAKKIVLGTPKFSIKENIFTKSWKRNLALACLDKRPERRPTFQEIIETMKTKTIITPPVLYTENKLYELDRKAVALMGAENFIEAKTILELLHTQYPFNLHILVNLIQCSYEYIKSNNKEKIVIFDQTKLNDIINKLESALEMYAWYADDKESLGTLLCNLSSYLLPVNQEKAKIYAEQAININQNDWQAAGNIAEASLILAEKKENIKIEYLKLAYKYAAFAYGRAPSDLTVICTFGKTLLALKLLEELKPILQRGIDIFGTNNLSFRLILIRYYIKNHEFSEATGTLKSMRNHKEIEPLIFQCDKEIIEEQFSDIIKKSTSPEAMTHSLLGDFYINIDSDEPDIENAVKHWLIAAKDGIGDAEFQLGVSYYHGKGVKQDQEKAIQYMLLAAKHGNQDAKAAIGIS